MSVRKKKKKKNRCFKQCKNKLSGKNTVREILEGTGWSSMRESAKDARRASGAQQVSWEEDWRDKRRGEWGMIS